MLLIAFALIITASVVLSARLAKSQAPETVKYPSSTRLSMSTLQRTHAVPEDRC